MGPSAYNSKTKGQQLAARFWFPHFHTKGNPLSKALSGAFKCTKPMTRCPGLSCVRSASLKTFRVHSYACKRLNLFPPPPPFSAAASSGSVFASLTKSCACPARVGTDSIPLGLLQLHSDGPGAVSTGSFLDSSWTLFAAPQPVWSEEEPLRNVSGSSSWK